MPRVDVSDDAGDHGAVMRQIFGTCVSRRSLIAELFVASLVQPFARNTPTVCTRSFGMTGLDT